MNKRISSALASLFALALLLPAFVVAQQQGNTQPAPPAARRGEAGEAGDGEAGEAGEVAGSCDEAPADEGTAAAAPDPSCLRVRVLAQGHRRRVLLRSLPHARAR